MKDASILKNSLSVKQLAWGMALYSGTSILGPLAVFIILGLYLDKHFDAKPIFLLSGVAVAFVVTNILLYKKVKILINKFNQLDEKNKTESGKKD
jgi:F0F1-type ATP synthase assembly protein I